MASSIKRELRFLLKKGKHPNFSLAVLELVPSQQPWNSFGTSARYVNIRLDHFCFHLRLSFCESGARLSKKKYSLFADRTFSFSISYPLPACHWLYATWLCRNQSQSAPLNFAALSPTSGRINGRTLSIRPLLFLESKMPTVPHHHDR